MRMAGRDAHDIWTARREAVAFFCRRVLDDISCRPRQHDVGFLGVVRVQWRTAAGTGLREDERELLEAVVLAEHEVPELARNVVKARHLLELDHIFGGIGWALRRLLVALRRRRLRMAMAALRLDARHGAARADCNKQRGRSLH